MWGGGVCGGRGHYYTDKKFCHVVVCVSLLLFSIQQILMRILLGYVENAKGTGHICAQVALFG